MARYRLKRKTYGIGEAIGNTLSNTVGGGMEMVGKAADTKLGGFAGALVHVFQSQHPAIFAGSAGQPAGAGGRYTDTGIGSSVKKQGVVVRRQWPAATTIF